MEIYEQRRLNLINQIGDIDGHGTVAKFARDNNLDPTYIRQIINKHRTMGEKAARKFELTLGLETGILDRAPHFEIREQTATYNRETLSEEAKAVAKAFDSVPVELQAGILRMLGILQDFDSKKRD